MQKILLRKLPDPVSPALCGGTALRWGILAPGFIAAKFVSALYQHTDQRVTAVDSRSVERAGEFARTHGIENALGDYRALVDSPEVDAVVNSQRLMKPENNWETIRMRHQNPLKLAEVSLTQERVR